MKTHINSKKKAFEKRVILTALIFLFGLMVSPMLAQNTDREVSGRIQSMDGPVSGASIILKGTSIWASSDDDGFFTFPQTLKQNDILVITSLGYYDKEVVIKGDTSHIEPILEDIEVVIVGALRTSSSKGEDGMKNE
ncbi:carboxypeptidase-like regulatory domain-containing protein [Aureitalea marina]|uniref:TonB-dependent receptor n=1 Tax=Aureitalea marina TaxID=930804 RepID=A0A2S7KSU8_9FLAO|nr:carboxypeptidase-like regulatory domain-containing protein [Aureitalea marina]PQB05700.1 hypothetical protein BST85_12925 [Aureitalea marina]